MGNFFLFVLLAGIMALTAAEALALARMAPDLQFILGEREVPLQLQAALSSAGFRSLGLFNSMVDSRAELRALLRADFDLDPAAVGLAAGVPLERRVNVARVVDAWDTSRKRQEEQDRSQAEQKASRLPMTLSRAQHINLRSRYERDFGRVGDKGWPCQALVERRFEEVDEGEVRADQLSEVVSQEELIDDPVGAVLDKDGAIRLRRAPRSVPQPATSVELWARVKVLGVTFQLAAYKHSSRLWLATASPQVWQLHLDYILGDKIGGFVVKMGEHSVRAPWQIILSYEYQVRKTACRLIMFDDMDLASAMLAAQRDLDTKEQFFSTPTALSVSLAKPLSTKRLWTDAPPVQTPFAKLKRDGKAAGKGDDGGKGKGKTKKLKKKGSGKSNWPNNKTPDGRNICFKYQTGACSNTGCSFVHVCTQCFGPHPMSACPAAGGGTAP